MTVAELLRHPLVIAFAMLHVAVFASVTGAIVSHVLAQRRVARQAAEYASNGKDRRDPRRNGATADQMEEALRILRDLRERQPGKEEWKPIIANIERIVESLEPIGQAARALAGETLQKALSKLAG